ncbi:MAG: aminotransferase class I/II-fold pyridoxal phosphate-dependent enzyme [Deltaproteobacteria bacterium]|nr:aminotransferase class I/II-fold pyridoxal phosphate-dependent enzyme [Deltaproteobacteria bacterium]
MKDKIWLSPPHMSGFEMGFVKEAFDSNWVAPLGPNVTAFENEMCRYTGAKNGVALCSGTAAIHLSLILLGVGYGDDVFCSGLTFAASANAIKYVGANPVFIDSDLASWNMDPLLLAEALESAHKKNRLPKAVIVVDLYGQCADYDPIIEACKKYDVPVIEDSAEALGAKYKGRAAGTFGEFAVLSFNGNKIITSSGGGMLLTPDSNQAAAALNLATQARDPAPHYQHSKVGYNYRMSNVVAGIGRGQLKVIDERVAARRGNFDFYQKHLGVFEGIRFMPEPDWSFSNRWLTCIIVDEAKLGVNREDLRLQLEKDNIEARPVWKPMHMQPVFKDCLSVGGRVSEYLFKDGLCLPSGSSLTVEQLHRVVESVKSILKTDG